MLKKYEKQHYNTLNILDLRKYNLDALVSIYKILKEIKQESNCFICDCDYENDLKNTLANIKYVILEKMLIEK